MGACCGKGRADSANPHVELREGAMPRDAERTSSRSGEKIVVRFREADRLYSVLLEWIGSSTSSERKGARAVCRGGVLGSTLVWTSWIDST